MKTLVSKVCIQPDKQYAMKHDEQRKADGELFMLGFMPVYFHSYVGSNAPPYNRNLPEDPLADPILMALCFSFIPANNDKADDVDDDGV